MALAASVSSTAAALKGLLLQPVFPASVLAFIAYAPPETVERVLRPDLIEKYLGVSDIRLPLKILVGLGLLRLLNRYLSRVALSNWTLSPPVRWNMREELAVITGACSGIGKAMALGLAEKGVHVAVLDVQPLPADMAAIPTIQYFKCDVTSHESVREAADNVRLTMGHPSILINNAGIAKSMTILDTSPEYLNKIIGVNMTSLWYTTKEFLPNMILKNKGHVVTIASAASFISLPSVAPYSATKAGALAFAECLRGEIAGFYKAPGVLSSSVHPMWVATEMTRPYADTISATNSGPMMTADKVANPVIWHIENARGGQIFCPEGASITAGLRNLPSWLASALTIVPTRGVTKTYQKPK